VFLDPVGVDQYFLPTHVLNSCGVVMTRHLERVRTDALTGERGEAVDVVETQTQADDAKAPLHSGR
jgi:hypothetical protein